MTFCKEQVCMIMLTVLCLLFGGCTDTVDETKISSQTAEASVSASEQYAEASSDAESVDDGIAIAVRFRKGNGAALSNGSASISDGETYVEYSLDDNGEMQASGLPRQGTLLLILFDQAERELGRTTVNLSTGAVIDASTDEAGTGYITLKENTTEVSLVFTLCGDGSLQCSLWLGV